MKNKLFLLLIICLFINNGIQAQENGRSKKIDFKGLVLDMDNNPVKNASVFIDGKNNKVLSDSKGRFELQFKPNIKAITVFTLDRGATELAYHGEKELTFVLASANKIQTESLNANYIKAHERNLSTNASQRDKNTLRNADQYRTIYDLLARQSGVTVSGSTVRIRGIGTLTQSTTPLFVVNGMPVQSIDNISSSQVKSISVLKDSDAAIYGVRGANGVIVITLKNSVND